MFNKLTKCVVVAMFAALMLPQISTAHAETEAPVKKITEMLYPTIMVDLSDGQGSGTVVFSGKRKHESWKDEKVWTLVLTNHHVIASAVSIEEEFDPKKGKNIQKETRRPVHVRLWDYNDYSTAVGTTGRVARIIAWDKHRDLALLRLDDKERIIKNVATLWPEDVGGPYLFQKTWAVGSGMSNPPYPTEGLLSGISGKDAKGRALYLSSAPIIFGNSGGSLWAYSKSRDRYEMIGVPSMVGAFGYGNIIPHIAWSRPISEIRAFLRENDYGFVVGDEDVAKEDPDAKDKDDKEK
jgi:S1-C subfamily serine protease|tara:strand:+ start:344 stop:1228 length:885 start_codon:yes stop_codon:yes gene_type:complete